MDYDLPDQNGVQTVSIIRNEFLDARLLMLTILDGEEDIYRAVSAGARGYLTKSCECEEVLDAIRTIAGGKGYFPAAINTKLKAREKRKPLTERELEILRLLVRAQSTKEIVDLMKLSMGTIRLHISIISEKLDAFGPHQCGRHRHRARDRQGRGVISEPARRHTRHGAP